MFQMCESFHVSLVSHLTAFDSCQNRSS